MRHRINDRGLKRNELKRGKPYSREKGSTIQLPYFQLNSRSVRVRTNASRHGLSAPDSCIPVCTLFDPFPSPVIRTRDKEGKQTSVAMMRIRPRIA